jgi:DNA-binding CsgD family transcriptional regulator
VSDAGEWAVRSDGLEAVLSVGRLHGLDAVPLAFLENIASRRPPSDTSILDVFHRRNPAALRSLSALEDLSSDLPAARATDVGGGGRSVAACVERAQRCRNGGETLRAANWFVAAAELATAHSERDEQLRQAARCLVQAVDPLGVRVVCDEWSAVDASAEWRLAAARAAGLSGDVRFAREQLDRAWELATAGDPGLATRVASHRAGVEIAAGDARAASQWLARVDSAVLGQVADDLDPVTRLVSARLLGGLASTDSAAPAPERPAAGLGAVIGAYVAGDLRRARGALDGVERSARADGRVAEAYYAAAWGAWIRFRSGDVDGAMRSAELAWSARDASAWSFAACGAAARLSPRAAIDPDADLRADASDLDRLVSYCAGSRPLRASRSQALAWTALVGGDPEAARSIAAEWQGSDLEAAALFGGVPLVRLAAIAAVADGDLTEVRRGADVLRVHPDPGERAWADRLAAIADGDGGGVAPGPKDTRGSGAWTWPFDAHLVSVVSGEPPSPSGFAGVERLVGHLRARRARRVATSRLARLRPAERRVVELVATGSTNHVIARELGVSIKTVETHLTSAYRALDVASRSELIARYAEVLGPTASSAARE